MEVNKGLLAFLAEEKVAVVVIVHEEVFGAEAVAGEVGLGGGVEGGGEGIGPGVVTGGVGAPAAGGEPAVAPAGGVAVDGDEEGGDDAACEEAVLDVFQESAVGAPLSLGVDAVAVVDEDLHS